MYTTCLLYIKTCVNQYKQSLPGIFLKKHYLEQFKLWILFGTQNQIERDIFNFS